MVSLQRTYKYISCCVVVLVTSSTRPQYPTATMEANIADVSAHICCPDPARSQHGAWLLSGDLTHRVEELQGQDPSLTAAKCFELLGAEWDEGYYDRAGEPPLHFLYKDPKRTSRTRISDGEEFRGAWSMTEDQKAEAVRLKTSNPTWEWSSCFETAGGDWCGSCECNSIDTSSSTNGC